MHRGEGDDGHFFKPLHGVRGFTPIGVTVGEFISEPGPGLNGGVRVVLRRSLPSSRVVGTTHMNFMKPWIIRTVLSRISHVHQQESAPATPSIYTSGADDNFWLQRAAWQSRTKREQSSTQGFVPRAIVRSRGLTTPYVDSFITRRLSAKNTSCTCYVLSPGTYAPLQL